MRKLSAGCFWFFFMLYTAPSIALPSFVWCHTDNICDITLGSDYAEPIQVSSDQVIYRLINDSYDFNSSDYLKETDYGEEIYRYNLGGMEDVFYWDSHGVYNAGLCIGGGFCGGDNSIFFPIDNASGRIITKITVTGHDHINSRKNAILKLYDRNTLIGSHHVSSSENTYEFIFTRKSSQELRLVSTNNDETLIKSISLHTDAIDTLPNCSPTYDMYGDPARLISQTATSCTYKIELDITENYNENAKCGPGWDSSREDIEDYEVLTCIETIYI